MSERVEDGGPAFPVVTSFLEREHRREPHRFTHDVTTAGGMSLRDYFAAKALAGFLANPGTQGITTALPFVAGVAYKMADAMLAARSPSEPLNARTQGVEGGR